LKKVEAQLGVAGIRATKNQFRSAQHRLLRLKKA
jgi:hypothetical protein